MHEKSLQRQKNTGPLVSSQERRALADPLMSLCLDMCRCVSIRRDCRVYASVTGWNNRRQQPRLAAPGCPACAPGWTPQAQGTCTYRLEARVARFYAARPAFSGFRSSGWPSAFPAGCVGGSLILAAFISASAAPQCSHKNSVALPMQPSNPEIRVSDVRASSFDRSLVGQACVARTRLRVDLRDSSGRQARERFLRR